MKVNFDAYVVGPTLTSFDFITRDVSGKVLAATISASRAVSSLLAEIMCFCWCSFLIS